jgi:hypothetical protein
MSDCAHFVLMEEGSSEEEYVYPHGLIESKSCQPDTMAKFPVSILPSPATKPHVLEHFSPGQEVPCANTKRGHHCLKSSV